MIILDTNVISELLAPLPSPAVEAWLASQPPLSVFTTATTQAEILYGLRLLPAGRRRSQLEAAILPIFEEDFAGRILPFDSEAADVYSVIAASRRQAGKPISQFDAQIAAIAASRGAALATHNVPDFLDTGIAIVNPWDHRD
ncbi:type II toxin-antitoxin system VapC family toxin [Rhizobium sp. CB3090]|uniref:type II toxin-antitoxin system VapC family toxin n=1 Tax=Rhizobium sp. CB3090 TaxID=3039156 RepID=UPI0024B26338|nr:type II toxin-antitoxin system VapC family toxin [Rhizobium sp. CB3090]WFU08681.1 type II toxin-antitoxin system VapC family toxin [Rhizobium sp. CB3090]